MHYNKCEGEGDVLYMFANNLDGFIHRLDPMRRYSFGVLGIYGEEPNLEIYGVLMWRGTEEFYLLEDHPSWEYYERRKLDISKEEDKKLLEDYWGHVEEDEVVEGRRIREMRIWK